MLKRLELRLEGMNVPGGLIAADRLVDIVKSLQGMTVGLARIETASAPKGRPSKHLDRVAGLRIGLEAGSTTIIVERDTPQDALPLVTADEAGVDRGFVELIESIGADRRPDWVTDSLANATASLVAALKRTAPKVELRVNGIGRTSFDTESIHRATWQAATPDPGNQDVTFTGRLFAVNLNTHRLQVQDDVGNQVALPRVRNDAEIGKLVGSYVRVTGVPEVDTSGSLTRIHDAKVELAPDPLGGQRVPASVPLGEILAGALGPAPGGI